LPATLSCGVVNRVSRLPRSVQGRYTFSFVVGISYLTRYGSKKNWHRSLRSLAVSGSAGATFSFLSVSGGVHGSLEEKELEAAFSADPHIRFFLLIPGFS